MCPRRPRRWLHSLATVLLLYGVGTAAAVVDEVDNRSAIYPGDLLLGGLFPLRGRGQFGNCSELHVHGLFALEALHFSLDRVNVRLGSQCGFTLGSVSLDTCASPTVGLYQVSPLFALAAFESATRWGATIVCPTTVVSDSSRALIRMDCVYRRFSLLCRR